MGNAMLAVHGPKTMSTRPEKWQEELTKIIFISIPVDLAETHRSVPKIQDATGCIMYLTVFGRMDNVDGNPICYQSVLDSVLRSIKIHTE